MLQTLSVGQAPLPLKPSLARRMIMHRYTRPSSPPLYLEFLQGAVVISSRTAIPGAARHIPLSDTTCDDESNLGPWLAASGKLFEAIDSLPLADDEFET
jgi:hypothetical protein